MSRNPRQHNVANDSQSHSFCIRKLVDYIRGPKSASHSIRKLSRGRHHHSWNISYKNLLSFKVALVLTHNEQPLGLMPELLADLLPTVLMIDEHNCVGEAEKHL